MAVAVYDSDLTAANGGELTIANASANWDESSNGAWDDAGTMVDETNFYIQGSECISAQFTKTGVGTIINIQGTAFTVDTDGAILIWSFWASPSSLATYANGGVRTLVGNTLGDFIAFKASGSDFEPNPIGGWYNFAIDPDVATVDTAVGSPTGIWTHVGMAINATAQSRGNPHAVDAIRVGRCSLEVTAGDATAYGTFTGMSNFDISTAQRYALFQKIFGGYRWQGLMSIGLAGTSVDFRDSNANIFVANTPMVSSAFNRIEFRNSASNIEWTSISMSAQDGVDNLIAATNSRGNFEVVDNATVVFNTCSFTDMGTFIFNDGANANTINGTTFRRCDKITTAGATLSGCTIDDTFNATVALTTSSPANAAKISDTEFISGGNGNGLEITGTAANITLSGLDFTGYSPTVDADKAIYVNIATGSMTINISGGSGVTASAHVRTAGAIVTVAADVSITFDKMKDDTEVRVYENTTVSATDISFTSPSTISSAGSEFGVFAIGDEITISGSANNNGSYKILTQSASTLTVTAANITTESAGASVSIKKTNQVEIDGIEDVTAGTVDNRSFTWASPAATVVDYVIHHWTGASPFYQSIRVNGYVVPGANTTININQLVNRNAS